jgi:hypothetical protein
MLDKFGEVFGIDPQRFLRAAAIATGIFVAFVILVFILGFPPGSPNLPNPYDVTEWPRVEATQTSELQNYSSYETEVENAEGDDETVTRYTIPIEEAKDLVVERGLPTR